jgi:hypothetical protein
MWKIGRNETKTVGLAFFKVSADAVHNWDKRKEMANKWRRRKDEEGRGKKREEEADH